MSILLGFLISIVLFFVTLPRKVLVKAIEAELERRKGEKSGNSSSKSSKSKDSKGDKKPKDLIRSKTKKKIDKVKKNDKLDDKSKKALILLLRSLQAFKAFMVTLKIAFSLLLMFISFLSSSIMITSLLMVVLLVCVISSVGSSWSSISSVSRPVQDNSGYVSTPIEADVAEIINMTDAEIWMLASESRFKSYDEANNAAKNNFESEKKFWTDLLVTVEVPAWKWSDDTKTNKVDSTVKIQVNKYVVEYWKSFMSDLHAQPEKYVIEEIGGFSFRAKNNGTGTSNLSAHSFGLVLDINSQSKGMGSNAAGIGDGTPWNSDQGLSEPYRSEACAFSGNWFNLVKKYRLDWGGLWTARSLDPMHFSIVGDRNRDTRNYKPNTSGQDPK